MRGKGAASRILLAGFDAPGSRPEDVIPARDAL
ncbi:hypothetical protein THITH_06550 [Thioalkalivibrio paradoxus ARh 1]|uniref:Uncharacterized protein n=1 Tax=Thioalkalivibrio paradoxus ARh 1 TaxID=713585 RepID=W0DNI1_9GAMM|nr:hypothetical protein THITH_06550 [Thioalkalivibrio paradoxus ARh 1]